MLRLNLTLQGAPFKLCLGGALLVGSNANGWNDSQHFSVPRGRPKP